MDWRGKKVLVTGAGGFIGSHLAEALVHAGAKTKALIHYNALGNIGWLATSDCRNDIEIVTGDVCDQGSVREAVRGAEVVFHLAALIAIPYSYRAPESYVRTNIQGTLNVLQAARELRVERLVHTSTSEVYGTAQYVPIDENHPLQGQSPYAASKIGADKFAEAFYCSFDLPVVTVRPFNAFGPRQSARAVIPTIITQYLNQGVVKLGRLTPTRDLNFVGNTVDGFMRAALVPEAIGNVINLGSGREISIGDLAQLIGRLVGGEILIEEEQQRMRPGKSEVERLLADPTRARALLGWEPQVTLEDGLSLTIDWVRQNLDRYQPGAYIL
ncbi:MAG: SDR family NAD(P)-dependent oxidoreductase [Candidatus Omnitrophica bacterium]|nr:SDR family NAD(P)-dependent oxidoreductase [Candidatus Omnitrophota bacterium]